MMVYVVIVAVLLVAELGYFWVADRFNIIDKPNLRSSHSSITLRGGGIVFLFGAWIYSVFFGFEYPWFLAGLTAIAGISFVDDVCGVPNKFRLVVHFVAMFLMFEQFGILNLESWWIIIIALIICVGIINAYNFMDGINGITGGYSLAVLIPLLFVNQQTEFIDSNFLIVAIASVLVFNLFNFRKRAKCFAGDVGAIGIAFIILFALGELVLKTGNVTYIIFLAVYGVDSVLTIIHRIMLHESLGEAHRKHAYQLMANELKLPHIGVSSLYMVLQLLVSFGLILLPVNNWIYSVGVLLLLSIVYILFKRKYYWMHEEYLKNK
ncbi:MAG: glycosyltransferase family 4 protein [Bacteroidales bacterium]